MLQGWECPKCKAVMGPAEKVCVNCKGSMHFPYTYDPLHPAFQPYIHDNTQCLVCGGWHHGLPCPRFNVTCESNVKDEK
jgi:hypothetical protein